MNTFYRSVAPRDDIHEPIFKQNTIPTATRLCSQLKALNLNNTLESSQTKFDFALDDEEEPVDIPKRVEEIVVTPNGTTRYSFVQFPTHFTS
jgi:hypothetical protein